MRAIVFWVLFILGALCGIGGLVPKLHPIVHQVFPSSFWGWPIFVVTMFVIFFPWQRTFLKIHQPAMPKMMRLLAFSQAMFWLVVSFVSLSYHALTYANHFAFVALLISFCAGQIATAGKKW
jgi:hypothetical protein